MVSSNWLVFFPWMCPARMISGGASPPLRMDEGVGSNLLLPCKGLTLKGYNSFVFTALWPEFSHRAISSCKRKMEGCIFILGDQVFNEMLGDQLL